MDVFLLGLIAFGLLLVLVLIIYLVDRVNALERDTKKAVQAMPSAQAQSRSVDAVAPFGGLAGRQLWESVSGNVPGIDPTELRLLRQRYEQVLTWHIEAIFEQGRRDGRSGTDLRPDNTRRINTLRGEVESWLPDDAVAALYQCGRRFATTDPSEWPALRVTIDDVCQELFSVVQFALPPLMSETLIGPEPDTPPVS